MNRFLLKTRTTARPKLAVRRCPVCGYCYRDFRRSSFLGCAHCYGFFRTPLHRYLNRMHGPLLHRGKYPVRFRSGRRRLREVELLRVKLLEALERKDYAAAVEIRRAIEAICFPS